MSLRYRELMSWFPCLMLVSRCDTILAGLGCIIGASLEPCRSAFCQRCREPQCVLQSAHPRAADRVRRPFNGALGLATWMTGER
jgi:hypothetical protein